MKKILLSLLFLVPSSGFGYQALFNSCTGCSDYVGVSSGALPSGSTQYIPNSSSPSGDTLNISSGAIPILNTQFIRSASTITIGGGPASSVGYPFAGFLPGNSSNIPPGMGINSNPFVLGSLSYDFTTPASPPMIVLGDYNGYGAIALWRGIALDHVGFVAPASGGLGEGDIFWTLPSTDTAGFWKSNGTKALSIAALASSDMSALLSSTNTWTGGNTFQSSFTVTASTANAYEARFSTSSAGFHVSISTTGHITTFGPSPVISACGTVPNGSVSGDDNEGTITVGGGVVTACTLTFASSWGVSPVCTITDNSTASTGDISSMSAVAFTTSFSVSVGGGTIWYRCGCSGTGCR